MLPKQYKPSMCIGKDAIILNCAMKWICALVGSLVGLIGEFISPWPTFIIDTARKIFNNNHCTIKHTVWTQSFLLQLLINFMKNVSD